MTGLSDRAVARLRAVAAEAGPGDVLDDRWELGEVLGEGGMGTVFAARDLARDEQVAVKVVRIVDAIAGVRFDREVDALGSLRHEAIVRLHHHGHVGADRYLVTELVAGVSLATVIRRQGALEVADVVAVGRRIAGALAAVHAAGLVHRDVTPSNVLLVDDDAARATLIDFGLAAGADDRVTRTGALVGTAGYAAPEQVRGAADVGPAADVFALGVILHECATGQALFDGTSTAAALAKVLVEAPPPLVDVRPEVPTVLGDLVASMLAPAAKDRPDAATIAGRLAELASAVARPAARRAPCADDHRLAPGTTVDGKYVIEREIGRGGMGVVLAARQLALGRRVAIKVLAAPHREADRARFQREARAAAQLENEHVVRVLDVGQRGDGAPFLVMELLEGRDLGRRLDDRGPLAPADAVDAVLQACVGLAEAHASGIVHRDLKPSNLFEVDRRTGPPIIKVLDFGVAKAVLEQGEEPSITETSAVVGSTPYMSPEQLASSRDVDARTDIWSLGVLLFELCSGTRPFVGGTPASIGARIAAEPPRSLSREVPGVDRGLEEVIARCLEKTPARRFADLAALARALAPFGGARAPELVARIDHALGRTGASLPSASEPTRAQRSTTTTRRAAVGAAVVAAVAAVTWLTSSRPWTAGSGPALPATPEPHRAGERPDASHRDARRAEPPPPGEARAAVEPAPIVNAPSAVATLVPRDGLPSAARSSPASRPATPQVSAEPASRPPTPTPSVSPPPRPTPEVDLRDPALLGR